MGGRLPEWADRSIQRSAVLQARPEFGNHLVSRGAIARRLTQTLSLLVEPASPALFT